jgi:Helix-turn-helix domain
MRSLGDALAELEIAQREDARRSAGPPNKAFYPGRGGFESYREHWQRLVLADRGLLPTAKVILMALSLYVNRERRAAWPGMRLLAKNTGLSPSTVARSVQAAANRGHLRITSEDGHNVYTPTLTVSSERNGLSPPDETCVYHPSETEPLTEPPTEPLSRRGEFDEGGWLEQGAYPPHLGRGPRPATQRKNDDRWLGNQRRLYRDTNS